MSRYNPSRSIVVNLTASNNISGSSINVNTIQTTNLTASNVISGSNIYGNNLYGTLMSTASSNQEFVTAMDEVATEVTNLNKDTNWHPLALPFTTSSFTTSYSGSYDFSLMINNINFNSITGWCGTRLRIIFDSGSVTRQIIGVDDGKWTLVEVAPNARRSFVKRFNVILSAGSHDASIEWKFLSDGGTSSPLSSAETNVVIAGQYVVS